MHFGISGFHPSWFRLDLTLWSRNISTIYKIMKCCYLSSLGKCWNFVTSSKTAFEFLCKYKCKCKCLIFFSTGLQYYIYIYQCVRALHILFIYNFFTLAWKGITKIDTYDGGICTQILVPFKVAIVSLALTKLYRLDHPRKWSWTRRSR